MPNSTDEKFTEMDANAAASHSVAEPQPKTKTYHGGTEPLRKHGENQLHRGDAEKLRARFQKREVVEQNPTEA
jgi:hypothetical protein